uniref:Uncharacterized protein n=1 Tax=Pan paniscus TaxID=9597 RepID=A0A2R9CLQ7_PANPA
MTWCHLQTASIILHPALDWCRGHTALLLTTCVLAVPYMEQTHPGPPWTASLLSAQLRSTSDTPSRDSYPHHLAFSVCVPLQGDVSSEGAATLSHTQPCSCVTNTWTCSIIKDEVVNLERSALLLIKCCGLSVAVLTGWEAQPLVGSWKQTLGGREE